MREIRVRALLASGTEVALTPTARPPRGRTT